MNQDPPHNTRASAGQASAPPAPIPRAPPLPAPRPLQRARDAASRLFGYSSRAPSPVEERDEERFSHGSIQFMRASSLSTAQNATASHKTGLQIRTLSINDSGSHALIAGKEIFKTVKIVDGHCAEDFNLRTAIRSTPTQASGQPRSIYSIDIADVAWAKGDSGDFVAAATSSGKIIVYDLGHAGLQAAQLHEHFRQVHNVTFNPHKGSLLLSGSQDGTVRLWDIRDVRGPASTIQSKRKYAGHSDGVRDVKWSPVESLDFAFGADNGEIQRWDLRKLNAAKVRVPAHSLACNTVDWHPDGKHILSAGSDKAVRVFDVSSSRPRKASWEIKTAFPVMHGRWRPSCQSSLPQDNGAQLCTQIITSYDREHPIMHVWDFRRPSLPFRELQPYASSPTDLLWHSQDLLWSVGREGTFLQTDIQHAHKVIDRCNLQAIEVSPLGELAFVAQARQRRRKSVSSLPLQPSSEHRTISHNAFLSRSWADDSLDHTFLSMLPTKKNKSHSASNSRSHAAASTSSTHNQNQTATIKLDDILLHRKSARPHQVACRGLLPVTDNHPAAVTFLAEKCTKGIPATSNDDDLFRDIESAFGTNADYCQSAGFHHAAKCWKLTGFWVMNVLKDRAALKRKRALHNSPAPRQDAETSSIERLAAKVVAQHSLSPTHSPGSVRPVSTIAQQLAAAPGSTSNLTTPLAKPFAHDNGHLNQDLTPLPDIDKDEQLTLPPSLSSTTPNSPPDSPGQHFPTHRRLTTDNLEDLQKLEPQDSSISRNDMVKRWNSQPKVPLSLDPVDANGIKIPPSKLENRGSGESFHFLVDSADSSRAPSFPASLESAESMPAARLSRTSKKAPTKPPQDAEHDNDPSGLGVGKHTETADFAVGKKPNISPQQPIHEYPKAKSHTGTEDLSPIDSVIDEQEEIIELKRPFSLVQLLKKLVEEYTVDKSSAQMPALLLLLMGPLLPRTHPLPIAEIHQTISGYVDYFLNSMGWNAHDIPSVVAQSLEQPLKAGLQPLQVESILSTYHEDLLRLRCFDEAAVLRKLAYPAYPAVYEDFLKDNSVRLDESLRVPGRRGGRENCPFCWEMVSPYGERDGGKLYSVCLLCGHGGHAACLEEWFGSSGGDGCPTEGCLCDCVDGAWRREKMGFAGEKGPQSVQSDEWVAKKGKAPEEARKMV